MKDILQYFNTQLLLKMISGLLFFGPMLLLTHRFYIEKYGKYEILTSTEEILKLLPDNYNRWGFGAIVFISIFLVSYVLQTHILPVVFRLLGDFTKKKETRVYTLSKEVTEKMIKKVYGENVLTDVLQGQEVEVISVLKTIIYPITIVILWMVYFNSIWSYAVIVVALLFVIAVSRMINTAIREYDMKIKIS